MDNFQRSNSDTLQFELPSEKAIDTSIDSIREKVTESEARESVVAQSMHESWGMPRASLEKKLAQVFGEPTERELYFAKKTLAENLGSSAEEKIQPSKKTFIVANPI